MFNILVCVYWKCLRLLLLYSQIHVFSVVVIVCVCVPILYNLSVIFLQCGRLAGTCCFCPTLQVFSE